MPAPQNLYNSVQIDAAVDEVLVTVVFFPNKYLNWRMVENFWPKLSRNFNYLIICLN